MKTWFLWPLLVGVVVLATDISYNVTDVEPPYKTAQGHTSAPSGSKAETEVKVSFVRGKLLQQKVVEHPETVVTEKEIEENVTDLADVTSHIFHETSTVKPKVKAQRAKLRRKRPFGGTRRVFADRVFGKSYGHGKPKVVVNKLKYDLLSNFTREGVANESTTGGEDLGMSGNRKRKMDFNVWKRLRVADDDFAIGKQKRDLRVWKNMPSSLHKSIRKLQAAPEVGHIKAKEVENNTESDLEPPKKALLTYRQFVEKKLSKFNRVQDLKNFTKSVKEKADDHEGSGEVGDLPHDHESAPLEGNVLSVMALP